MNNEATMFALWLCVLIRASSFLRHSSFVLRHSAHSSFVIRHFANSSFVILFVRHSAHATAH